jgi:Zn-dependent protease with chaperone function/Flp pilus assembly protein TadD
MAWILAACCMLADADASAARLAEGYRLDYAADYQGAAETFDDASWEDYEYEYDDDDYSSPWWEHPRYDAVKLLVAWGFLFLVYLAAGRRQRREGRGTVWRWIWVSAVAAIAAAAPYGIWLGTGRLLDEFAPPLASALVAIVPAAALVAVSLGLPVRIGGQRTTLPEVEDAAFTSRLAELAAGMRLRVPVARLLPSSSGSQAAQAVAGGLVAPSLVVTDGILYRLSPDERDAVVAHELAHIANGSLWLYGLVGSAACAAAAAASWFVPVWILVGTAAYVGLRRIAHRFVEIDCDRRAAEAVGYRQTASALKKIHAVHPVRQTGWLSRLVYATATHPSLEIRLEALRRAAPAAEKPTIEYSQAEARWRRRLSWFALSIWLAALATTAASALRPEVLAAATAALVVVTFGPLGLLMLGVRKKARRARRLLGSHRTLAGRLRLAIVVVAAGVLVLSPWTPMWFGNHALFACLTLVAILAIVVCLWSANRGAKIERRVATAMQLHNFQEALQAAAQAPKVVARRPLLRYNVAVSAAVTGDRARGIAELEALSEDRPKLYLASLVLAVICLDEDRPEQALEIAQRLAVPLKHNSDPHVLAARALRRLGRPDEAAAAVDRALAVEPDSGEACALAAALALDRGETAEADRRIARADELAPGDAMVKIVQAEIALKSSDLEAARQAVAAATASVRNNPYLFLATEIRGLSEQLARRASEGVS